MIGGGLSDPRPALTADDAEAWRAHLLRATRSVAGAPICGPLTPVFAALRGDPTARLVRLLGLLGALPVLLEGLRGAVLRQVRTERSWTRAPHGGRIDVPASLLAQARHQPRPWRVMHIRACVDSPTNTLVASGLADVRRALSVLRQLGLYRGEREAFERANLQLRRFLAQSPLGELEPVGRRRWPALRRAARLRTIEYRAARPFLDWWDAVRASRLEALRGTDGSLSVGGCFELTTLIRLAAGLADLDPQVGAPGSGQPSFRVRGRTVWIRNLDPASATDLRSMLGPDHLLVTPADVLDAHGHPTAAPWVAHMRAFIARETA